MSAAVGADVESICRKCGDVWHVVVAKVGEAIAKVQCKECGSLHKPRPPGSKAAATAVRKRSASRAPKKEVSRHEPSVEVDLSKAIRPYSPREHFAVGERIDHPKFGIGIIENTATAGKIEVFFPDGRRVLAAAKEAGKLSSLSQAQPRWLEDSE